MLASSLRSFIRREIWNESLMQNAQGMSASRSTRPNSGGKLKICAERFTDEPTSPVPALRKELRLPGAYGRTGGRIQFQASAG